MNTRILTILFTLSTVSLLISAGMGQIFYLSAAPAQGINLYVCTSGSDQANGQSAAPFATLEHAMEVAAQEIAKDNQRDIIVFLRGGLHAIHQTLVIDRRFSMADGSRFTIRSYPGQQAILSAGKAINQWTRTDLPGNIWVADIPVGHHNLTLYQRGSVLPRARGAGFVPLRQYDTWHTPHKDTIEFPSGALQNFPDIAHAEMVVRTSAAWAMHIVPLISVNEAENYAKVQEGVYSLGRIRHRPSPADSMWVENVLSVLDEPGEWVVHPDEGKLYYWPDDDGSPGEVLLPMLSEIIRVEGDIDMDGPEDIPVRGIHFKGLSFMHADRVATPGDIYQMGLQHGWDVFDAPNAMLRFRGAENCSVVDCFFGVAGDNGLRLDLHAQDIVIKQNLFANLGGAATVFAGYGLGTKDVNKNNQFINNHIHHVSQLKWDRPALFVWQSGSNIIRGNLIHHIPYIGLSISCRTNFLGQGEGWGTRREHEIQSQILYRGREWRGYEGWILRERYWHGRDNIVENNEFFAVMERMGDGNAIYISGTAGGNIIRHNHIHNVWSDSMGAAIRCDDDQHETLIEGNIIRAMTSGIWGISIKGRNDVINNFMMDLHQASDQRHYGMLTFQTFHPDGAIVKNNIFVTDQPDNTRPVLAGSGRRLVGTNQVVQQNFPIDLSLSEVENNLFWSDSPMVGIPLFFSAGGEGWLADWQSNVIAGVTVLNPDKVLLSNARGYDNQVQHSRSASLMHNGQWLLLERSFANQPIQSGEIWVSFLSHRSHTNSHADRSGIFFPITTDKGQDGLFIGVRARQFGIGTSSGFLNLVDAPGNSADRTHHILARIQLDTNRVEMWLNPRDMRSIGNLGTPDLVDDSRVLVAIDPNFHFRLEGQNNQVSNHMDDFRIAWGTNESRLLQSLATGRPVDGVSLALDNFAISDAISLPLDWAQDYLVHAQANGFEMGSLSGDPLFVDPEAGDFSFLADSPALALGIKPLSTADMGLDRSHWDPRLAERSSYVADRFLNLALAQRELVLSGAGVDRAGQILEQVDDLKYIP
jgi:hypothetical protein